MFSVPEAAALASLIGQWSDMKRVIAYCELMIDRYASSKHKRSPFHIVGFNTRINWTDWGALSTAACISYARCFTTGVREALNQALLDSAASEFRTLHEFVLNLRNKHIAHSVNSFEENLVTLHIGEHFASSQEIETVAASNTRVIGLHIDVPAQLKRLAEWWLTELDKQMAVQRAKLLLIARATPLSELKAHGVPQPRVDPSGRVAKRRKHP